MDYRTKLQEITTASGLSQQSLAEKIGTSLVSLNNWLNGKSTPTRKALLMKIDDLYVKYSSLEENEKSERRIKYYGIRDLATSFYLKPTMKLLDNFNETKTDYSINDILEIYNVLLYVDNLALPKNIEKQKLDEYIALKPKLHKTIATFFNAVTERNVLTIISEVKFDYHDDLLILLARYKRYDNINSDVMLRALRSSKVAIWSLLANKDIVNKYDQDIRTLILSDPNNAEQVIHKYLERKERREVHLPPSFTKDDAHSLLESYINGTGANPNYLQLIANARVIPNAGIDDKIKLLAKRKHTEWNDNFFKDNGGSVVFAEVAISDTQEEAVEISQDDTTTKFTYSKRWLKEHSDNLSALSNFIHLFPLVNKHLILTLPSYSSQLGIVERFMKVTGRDEYPEGVHFQFIDQSTLMQTMMYERFLRSEDKELEEVIEWFFNEYLKKTFNANGFNYTTSSKGTTYLEKCKHVFSEMDSVIKQFKLYAENGLIDQGLLSITSESPKYKDIPSQVASKYAYATDSPVIFTVMHYLFSDQSGLTYIDDKLKDEDFVSLLVNHEVNYSDFHDYQKQSLDELIKLGLLRKTSKRLVFQSQRQILILKNLFQAEALSYYHYSAEGRDEIDAMVSKGWLMKKSSLLTDPEAKYFSFYLNQQDSSNGHDLRNIYLHGSMSGDDKKNENKHYQTYLIALRLFIALIIKIDDDFSIKLQITK